MQKTREEAQEIHRKDPELKLPEHRALGVWFQKALEDAAQTLKSG